MWAVEISIYLLTLLGSGAGFMTQMLVSGYWTTAFSEDVFHYSINLSAYLLALGIGSFFSKRIKSPSVVTLATMVLSVSFLSGVAIPLLRLAIKYFGNVFLFPVAIMLVSGTLCGMVIPLALRITENTKKISLGTLFFVDYSAATLFTFLFTFVCLVPLGHTKTGLLMCGLTSILCFCILLRLKRFSSRLAVFSVLGLGVVGLMFTLAHVSIAPNSDRTGTAQVILNEQSYYQKILMTEEYRYSSLKIPIKEQILFLDGFIQFSSVGEANYHFCIANFPLLASKFLNRQIKKVLVLGGGDGLVVRNLVTEKEIEKITLVELDPAMIKLAEENPILRSYNKDSLHNPKVTVVIADAFRWVMEQYKNPKEKYDLIIIDFPLPKNFTLARLFSAEFYRATFKLLESEGFVTIQSGPSYLLEDNRHITVSKVASSILKTVQAVGLAGYPYVSPDEREAFVIATNHPRFNMEDFTRAYNFLGNGAFSQVCRYEPRWLIPEVEVNTLNTLPLSRYMMEWHKANKNKIFFYRGNHLIFLPD